MRRVDAIEKLAAQLNADLKAKMDGARSAAELGRIMADMGDSVEALRLLEEAGRLSDEAAEGMPLYEVLRDMLGRLIERGDKEWLREQLAKH